MSAIATLKAMLGLDSSQYLREMDVATRRARGFESDFKRVTGNINNALGAIGAGLSFGAIIGGIKSVLSWADQLSEAASQVGMLTGEMAALNRVALQNGVNINDVSRFVAKLQNNIFDAASGNEKLSQAFADVGLNAVALNGMLPVDQLRAVMQAAVDSGRPLTALSELVGDKLGPSFVNLATAVAGSGLGEVNSDLSESIDKAAKAADAVALMTEKVKELGAQIITSKPAEALIDVYQRVIDKIKETGVASVTLPGIIKNVAGALGDRAGAGEPAAMAGKTPEELQAESAAARVEAAAKSKADAEKPEKSPSPAKQDKSADDEAKRQARQEAALLREKLEEESARDEVRKVELEIKDERDRAAQMDAVRFARSSFESVGAQVGGPGRANISGIDNTAKLQLRRLERLESELQEANTKLAQLVAANTGPEGV